MNGPANLFELLGLEAVYAIDAAALENAYRELQSRVHPDRFAVAPAAERLQALHWATRANEAYRTLREPVERGRYLLKLRGYDTAEETDTAMPPDFLMQQMEWREQAAGARAKRDAAGLGELRAEIAAERSAMLERLGRALDVESNYDAGCSLVRKLRFLQKLDREIDDALHDLIAA